MIELHRLGHEGPFQLNPDLILTVEARPDTVVTLTTGAKVVVSESPGEVLDGVRRWRVAILAEALAQRPARAVRAPA
jgi:flagellar protein FlbD